MLQLFEKVQGYNNQLVLEFAEKFETSSVTLKGYQILITVDSISEFTGLPKTREYLNKMDHYSNLLNRFHPTNKPKAKIYSTKGHIQGVKWETSPEKWALVAKWVMQYLTCVGKHLTLMGHNLKLLIFLRYKKYRECNLSWFLHQSLQRMSRKVREKQRNKLSSLKHHGLSYCSTKSIS